MTTFKLHIVNRSALVSTETLLPVVTAVQQQIIEHVGPVWNVSAALEIVNNGELVSADAWCIYLVDGLDTPGALGFHSDDCVPVGYVDVTAAQDDGVSWSSVLSHEILELIVDPWAELNYQVRDRVYALEICDPTEGKPYRLDGVEVENFVYPNWYKPGSLGPWDHLGVLTAPLQIAAGGYASTAAIEAWTQENGPAVRTSKRTASHMSRRGRRVEKSVIEEQMTEDEAIIKLAKACTVDCATDGEACCAVSALKVLGWKPSLFVGRTGLTFLMQKP